MNGLVGELDRSAQGVCALGNTFESLAENLSVCAMQIVLKVAQHGLHCDLAGPLACGPPTHAVAHHEDSFSYIETKVVLVIRSDPANISLTFDLDTELHRAAAPRHRNAVAGAPSTVTESVYGGNSELSNLFVVTDLKELTPSGCTRFCNRS